MPRLGDSSRFTFENSYSAVGNVSSKDHSKSHQQPLDELWTCIYLTCVEQSSHFMMHEAIDAAELATNATFKRLPLFVVHRKDAVQNSKPI